MAEEIKVNINGDPSGAEEALGRVSKAAESFGDALKSLAGAFAFDKIAGAFTDILAESSKAEIESRRFIATLSGVGSAVDPDRFFALADSLERVTTFEAEASMQAGAMLGRFGMQQDQIEALLPLTQDLAAYMGTDLASAADNVGRAVSVGAVGLRALNLGFTATERAAFDAANETQRTAILMDRLKAQVGGTAQMMAGTATGAITQFRTAIGNVEEAFGGILDAPIAEAIRTATGAVTEATSWFMGLSDGTKALLANLATGVGVFAAVTSGVVAVSGALGVLGGLLPAITTGWATMGAAATTAWTRVLAPLAAIIAGIVGVVLIIGALHQAWVGDLGGMQTFAINWVRDVKYLWVELVDFLTTLWDDFVSGFAEGLITAVGWAKGETPEETHAKVEASKASGHAGLDSNKLKGTIDDAFKTASDGVQNAMSVGGDLLKGVWADLRATFAEGAGVLGAVAKQFGFDGSAFSKTTAPATHDKIAATRKEEFKGLDFSVLADSGEQAKVAAIAASMMASMAGVSEDQWAKILASVDGDVDKAMDVAQQFASVKGVTADATGRIASYWDGAAGQLQLTFAAIGGGLAQLGKNLLNNMGSAGSTINNAMQAAATGGPMAAAVSVLGDVMSQSESFQAISARLSAMLANLAQAFNPLFDALGPILGVVETVVGAIGEQLGGIFTQLAPLFLMVGDLLKGFEPILTTLVGVFGSILGNLLGAVMPIVATIMPIVQLIADLLSAFAPVLNILALPMQLVATAFSALQPVLNILFEALKFVGGIMIEGAKGVAMIWNGIISAVQWVLRMIDKIIPGDALNGLADSIGNAKINMDNLGKAQDNLSNSTNNVGRSAEQIKKPIDKASEALGNVPTVLKVTRLRLDAAMAEGVAGTLASTSVARALTGSAVGGASNDASRTVNVGTLNINGGGGTDAADALKRAMEADKYRLTGSTQGTAYPNATPRTAGAH